MKWYSIKKHRPPINVELILRIAITNPDTSRYDERYITAELESNYIYIDDIENWFTCCPTCQKGFSMRGYDVTHFAIPDPIKIEHE